MTKIGIILGSTRPNRNGEQVAKWVLEIASSHGLAFWHGHDQWIVSRSMAAGDPVAGIAGRAGRVHRCHRQRDVLPVAGRQFGDADHGVRMQHRQALDQVRQLADIARPVIGPQGMDSIR